MSDHEDPTLQAANAAWSQDNESPEDPFTGRSAEEINRVFGGLFAKPTPGTPKHHTWAITVNSAISIVLIGGVAATAIVAPIYLTVAAALIAIALIVALFFAVNR